ncbi:glycosyltransferase family 9 protein [Nocardioides sp. Kera G14]|uniref:glycosyltransferase family 9 protein n=1 Tax=Nocardioides sp. Kera G14 TaxID=2884264 RepID=UPI001D0F4A9A|nr:glycosyltransferase family 9 protein [Nocardioides sp. Kera G14]UDY24976.1 glycosyltransferase family 9 protein [Nocardioides sp. Kera G14]
MTRPRALVYRAIGLGDLLTGVPALRALRRALPDHEIVLAAPAAQRPLVELIDAVDRLIPTAELEPVAWDGPPPDVGIDLHGNGPASRTLVEALLPRLLLRYDLSTWDPEEHERVRWCRLIGSAFEVEADADDVALDPPAVGSPAPDTVVVHPGAASGSRRWPAERFATVATALASRGEQVVITGSPDEAPLAEEVRRQAGLPAEAVLAGRTDLAELAALTAEARLVVAGDTGMAHLASAYGIPSVLLFGPTPPSRWGPPPGPHTVLWHGTGVGDPHATDPDPALLEITVDEVLAAATRQLSRRAAPPSIAPSA